MGLWDSDGQQCECFCGVGAERLGQLSGKMEHVFWEVQYNRDVPASSPASN